MIEQLLVLLYYIPPRIPVWVLALALKSEHKWRKDYRQKEWDLGLFRVGFIRVNVWGIFGVSEAKRLLTYCMDTDIA